MATKGKRTHHQRIPPVVVPNLAIAPHHRRDICIRQFGLRAKVPPSAAPCAAGVDIDVACECAAVEGPVRRERPGRQRLLHAPAEAPADDERAHDDGAGDGEEEEEGGEEGEAAEANGSVGGGR